MKGYSLVRLRLNWLSLVLSVIPAQAGIQGFKAMHVTLDARFRGHDEKKRAPGTSKGRILARFLITSACRISTA
jgi:hypothetical protein